MHLANASNRFCSVVSPRPGSGLPLGARRRHALNAARTVGAPTLIVEGIRTLPSAPGSGKLGTP
jgi:hypothetical protein